MTLYNPFSATIEKMRLLFKRRVRDGQLAYLGDSSLPGARVEIPDKKGYVYARFPLTGDTFSPPFQVRSSGVAFQNYPGCPVYVAIGYNGELEIVSAHYQELDRNNIDTRTLNPLHQQSKWVYLWQLTIALCSAVSTSVTGSYLVTVKKFRHYTGNIFATFETATAADKIDLSSYVPATDMHRYAAVWIDTYGNVAEVVASTPQSLFTPLDETDVQECVDNPPGRPPDAVALKLFYLANDQGTIRQQPAEDRDVRMFLNMPQVWGFPDTLTTRERVRPGYTLITGAISTSGNGDLTVEPGGKHIEVPDNPMGSFNVAADSGTPANIEDGETVTVHGTGGIAASISGNTVTVDGSGISAAPANAHYLTSQAESGLSNEVNLGALTTGLLKHTVSAGVSTPATATAGTDYTSPTGTENLSNKTITASSLVATALSLLIATFKAIFTHANTADRTYTLPDKNGTVAMTSDIALNAMTSVTGDVTGTGPGATATTLANSGVSAGDYENPRLAIDAKGRTTAASNGSRIKREVIVATVAALPACIYANGSSGVGATLTASVNGALTIDLISVANGDRVLIKSQSSQLQNGIYDVTDAGSAGTPFILTRSTDADTGAKLALCTVIVLRIQAGSLRGTAWNNGNSSITMGTTAITFSTYWALPTLSNLDANTAINESLVSDTDNQDNLGSSAKKWASTFNNATVFEERTAPSTPATADYVIYAKTVGGGAALFGKDDAGTEKQISVSVAKLVDSKATTTQGGGSSAATWNARDLNTEQYDPDGIVTVSSNKFVLVAGDYEVTARSPVVGGTGGTAARNRIFNVTAATSVKEGIDIFAAASAGGIAIVTYKFTSNGTDEYRIDTYTSTAKTTNGLGNAVSDGSAEIYTEVEIKKVA